ncbi:flagellar hook-length control protein FliK [Novipirellula rosea]|uniref:Flagellar hook-length control protein FliK n=2 Tax=Novipirellula TaxID=2795426 RepID=A0ABP8MXZ3_9BACT
MSESQTTSSTAGVRTPTQNRLRSLGTQLQSVDPSSGIIDAFADVFAQIAAIESPQTAKSLPAASESSSPPESSSQNEASEDATAAESNEADEADEADVLAQENASDLASLAIPSGNSDNNANQEAVADATSGEERIVAESESTEDATANDASVLAAATVQNNTDANEQDDNVSVDQTEQADANAVLPTGEQEQAKQKSSQQEAETSTESLARVQTTDKTTAETSEDTTTDAESVSTDATPETESESNSGDHRRDSRQRRRDHFGPVNGGDRSGGGTIDEAASATRSGQAAAPSLSATATLPIPESLSSVEPTTIQGANVSPAAQQAVEAITQTAAAAAGAARTTAAATANASSATSTNSAARDGSGAIGGPNSTTSAADATTKRAEKSGNSSTTDLISRAKLIQRVSRAFQHLGPDGGNVRLRLAPAELGTVRLEMQIKSNKIQTRVVAETEAAAAALRENLPELRARLQSQGMQIEQLSVEVEKDPQSGERSFSGHQSGAEQGGAGYSSGDRWQSPRQSPRPRPNRDIAASVNSGPSNTPQIASRSTGVDVKL